MTELTCSPLSDFLERRRVMRARKQKLVAVVTDTSRDEDERHACHVLAYKIGRVLEEQPIRSKGRAP